MSESELSPAQQAFFQNPYPAYQLARQSRITWDEAFGFWRISRFSDVENILKDRRFAKNPPAGLEHRVALQQQDRFNRGILNLDPPDHTRIRALMVKAFSAKRMQAMRPIIQDLVTQLISRHRAAGSMEIKSEFAHPIPATIISDMLGIPMRDRDRFAQLSHDIILYGNDLLNKDPQRADAAVEEFDEYLTTLFKDKRAHPADDLTTALINERDDQGHLSEEELHHNIRLLFIAGHETTVNLICNALIALHRHPEQKALLSKHPELMPTAVEEFLRYDSSVQQLPRVAQEDVVLDGQTILAGQMVVLMLGAANHDADIWSDPDSLDVQRPVVRAKSFGGGAHFCLGAQLARIETEIVLSSLLQQLPGLQITNLEKLSYPPNPFFRGPLALWASW